MSRYSGKCDVYDTLISIHKYTEDEFKNNVEIYIGNNEEPLHIECSKDIIPYYPYLISSAFFDNEKRKSVIHLSSESFIDKEEREQLEFYLKQVMKFYNRCKHKKIEFNIEDVIKEVCFKGWNKEQVIEIFNRIKRDSKNATIKGIHLNMYEYYRKVLVQEMLKNGLNPSEYGYGRFVKESEKNKSIKE